MDYDKLFNDYPIIKSDDIVLKRIESKDIQEFFIMHSNEEVFKYIPGKPKKNIETIKNMVNHYERDFNKKKMIFLGIYSKDQNMKLVGMMEIFDIDKKTDMLTIGYRLIPENWGKGYATKSTLLLVDYLFNEIKVNRIQAFVMTENEKSSRVVERCGFVCEGTIRQGQFWKEKGLVDLKIYSKLLSENGM